MAGELRNHTAEGNEVVARKNPGSAGRAGIILQAGKETENWRHSSGAKNLRHYRAGAWLFLHGLLVSTEGLPRKKIMRRPLLHRYR
jgi:hypothetical protein